MALRRFTPSFLLIALLCQDLVSAGTFVPVPLEPTTTVHPTLYRKTRTDELQLTRYALASPPAVQLRNSRSSQRCNRCDDWPPRREDDRNDRYDKDRYPDDRYDSRPSHSNHEQDSKDRYNSKNDDKGYNNRNDDKGYGNRNEDNKGNRNDDRYQGSYGKPSEYDRNKSGSGVDDKQYRPDTKFDNRPSRPTDDRRGSGNGNGNRHNDRDEGNRYDDRNKDRDRDRYGPGSDREYDRGNGYDNRRPPPYDDRHDRYDRRPYQNEDRYEPRPRPRPYYPEDRYDRRPAYDERERDPPSRWQSYDRYGNRHPSYDDRRQPYDDRRQDDRYNRYDDRYDDRGSGYDNRPEEDRYRKQGSFRPWDETYRGTSGFDNNGKGYYFASGRPEVGATSAWGEGYNGGYASSWQYGGKREDAGGRGGAGGWGGASVDRGRPYPSSSANGWNEQSSGSGWRRPGSRPSAPGDTSYLYDRPSSQAPPLASEATEREAKNTERPLKEDDSINDTGSKSI